MFAAVTCVIAFNNCGEGFVMKNLSSSSVLNNSGGVFFSRAPGESCEDALLNVYKATYHPFLSQTCNSCHVVGGGGSGTFAVRDPLDSYSAFVGKNLDLINSQSVGSHRPPYTGPHNASRVTEISEHWATAQTAYASCLAEEGGGPGAISVIKTTAKKVAANLGTTYTRMEWDLETQSNGKVPLVAGIEIRRATISGETRGYEFRGPTLRLKSAAAGAYTVKGLYLSINGQLRTEMSTYRSVQATISSTTNVNLAPDSGSALAALVPASSDEIALEFQYLNRGSGGGTTPPPTPSATPPPSPSATPIGVVTYASLAANGGIFAESCFSCHSSGNARGGLDLTSYSAARTAAQNIKSRINNDANPMPTGGLLPQDQRDRIDAWVDQGAPQ